MESKEETVKHRFSGEGYEELKTLFKTLVRLFNENTFPFNSYVLGFGSLSIEDREECFGRIKQLSDILYIPFKLNKLSDNQGSVIDYQILI
jgi:hypothetical protein